MSSQERKAATSPQRGGRIGPQGSLPAPERLSEIIGSIYDCVLDPQRWSGALESICREFSFVNAVLGVVPFRAEMSSVQASFGVEPYWLQRSAEMNADVIDAWGGLARIQQFPLDEPIVHSQAVEEDVIRRSRYVREWATPQGVFDAVAIAIVRDPTMIGNVAFGRHVSAGAIGEFELAGLRLLAPHFRRAVTISNLFDMKVVEAASLGGTLDSLLHGVILVDQDLGIVHANAAAESVLAAGHKLRSDKGLLTLSDRTAHAALVRAVRAAAAGEIALGAKGIGIPVLGSKGELVVVHVLPLRHGELRHGLAPRAQAVLFIASAATPSRMPTDALALLYDLTPAEKRVFELIADGKSPAQIARTLGIAASTVKTHTLRVLEKTGSKRQADLVRLAAGLAAPG